MIVLPAMPPEQTASWVGLLEADPTMLATFTYPLTDLGFRTAGSAAAGPQHPGGGGAASIDVLRPDGIGARASRRPQALQRRETVAGLLEVPDAENSFDRVATAGEL
jgi:hypothetical protein